MLDLNILKWSWSQRFILISYILTFWVALCKPHAYLVNEGISKYFKSPLHWITLIALLIAASSCYGFYKIKTKNYIMIALAGVVLETFFLIMGFVKDRRLPTRYFFLTILMIAVTIGLIYYDKLNYVYDEK